MKKNDRMMIEWIEWIFITIALVGAYFASGQANQLTMKKNRLFKANICFLIANIFGVLWFSCMNPDLAYSILSMIYILLAIRGIWKNRK